MFLMSEVLLQPGERVDGICPDKHRVRPLRKTRPRTPLQGCHSRKATMGRELMAPRTDRTTGVASPLSTNHAAKGSVFVNLGETGNFED